MKAKYLYLYLAAGMASLTACTEDIEYSAVDYNSCIKVEVTDEVAANITRADYSGFPATTFEEGDAIGVYAFNGSSYVSSNVKFTRQSDGSWTPASTVVYNPDYTYYAYFPWRSSTYTPSTSGTVDAVDTKFANFISDGSNYFWQANQSTKANFTASNLMIAKGIVTGSRTVKFTMAHKRGLAIISPAVNQWYYTDDAGTKYNLSPVFSGNIPYEESGTRYFLLKPNTTTSVAGLSLRAGAGKYMTSNGIEMTGTPTYTYYLNGSSSTSSKPAWLTITANVVDGEPTEFSVSSTPASSSSYRTYSEAASSAETTALKANTAAVNTDLSMVDNAGNARASRTTANCYLVHAPGTYKIPLVYGNAIKNGSTNRSAYYTTTSSTDIRTNFVNHNDASIYTGNDENDPWIKNHSITVAGAKLVWQDVQGMISSVGIDGDYLTFTVDENNIAPGNAVIAATTGAGGTGDVVWSWHIWVTTETLANTTRVATGSHNYDLAPVNVGWISSTVRTYTGNTCRVQATSNGVTLTFDVTQANGTMPVSGYHPYYQWGRKDAELPSTGTGNTNHAGYTIDGSFSFSYLQSNVSIGTTIKNPGIHYYSSSTYGPYNENKYNYWDMENTALDNSNSTSRAVATVKTVYDPCPPDFCVPTSNCFYYIYSNYSSYFTWTSTPAGRTWKMSGANVFFPASGCRNGSNGTLNNVGSYGYYWTATPYSTNSGRPLGFRSSSTGWNGDSRAYGCPVRAVAEE